MRIALFSDVHAIYQSLTAMHKSAVLEGAKVYWCLGDVIGYGPYPIEILSQLRKLLIGGTGNVCLLGNHDDAASRGIGPEQVMVIEDTQIRNNKFNECAWKTVKKHHDILEKEENSHHCEWLAGLHPTAEPLEGFFLAHGYYQPDNRERSLWWYGTSHIAFVKQQVGLIQANVEAGMGHPLRLLANGHYHVPALWQWDSCQQEFIGKDPFALDWYSFTDVKTNPIALNPGSISLPRLLNSEASSTYVLLDVSDDLQTIQVGFRHVAFNWKPLTEGPTAPIHRGYPCAQDLRKQLSHCPLPSVT